METFTNEHLIPFYTLMTLKLLINFFMSDLENMETFTNEHLIPSYTLMTLKFLVNSIFNFTSEHAVEIKRSPRYNALIKHFLYKFANPISYQLEP